MSILGIMFLIMFGLKLAGILTISWWLVTAPLWGGLIFYAIIFSVFASAVDKGRRGRRF